MDQHTPIPAAPGRHPWHVAIDMRDVIGVAGGVMVLTAAYVFDWRAAVAVAGTALCALAWRLSR